MISSSAWIDTLNLCTKELTSPSRKRGAFLFDVIFSFVWIQSPDLYRFFLQENHLFLYVEEQWKYVQFFGV